jgi:hypothetical protein
VVASGRETVDVAIGTSTISLHSGHRACFPANATGANSLCPLEQRTEILLGFALTFSGVIWLERPTAGGVPGILMIDWHLWQRTFLPARSSRKESLWPFEQVIEKGMFCCSQEL